MPREIDGVDLLINYTGQLLQGIIKPLIQNTLIDEYWPGQYQRRHGGREQERDSFVSDEVDTKRTQKLDLSADLSCPRLGTEQNETISCKCLLQRHFVRR